MTKKKRNKEDKSTITGSIVASGKGKVKKSNINQSVTVNWHKKSLAVGFLIGILMSIISEYIWGWLNSTFNIFP